jgi:hypothetical protein
LVGGFEERATNFDNKRSVVRGAGDDRGNIFRARVDLDWIDGLRRCHAK